MLGQPDYVRGIPVRDPDYPERTRFSGSDHGIDPVERVPPLAGPEKGCIIDIMAIMAILRL